MPAPGRVIVLSGPIGAGKTTVAKALIKRSPSPIVHLEGDRFWKVFDEGANCFGMGRNFKLLVGCLLGSSVPLARGGYDVLIDFTVPIESIDHFHELLSQRSVPLHWVTLLPSLPTCAERADTRRAGRIADYSRFNEFYAEYCDSPTPPFDNELVPPAEAAWRIWEGIEAGEYLIKDRPAYRRPVSGG